MSPTLPAFCMSTPWGRVRGEDPLTGLPEAQALVRSLFAYDVIGFHTEEWLSSFRDYCTAELGATIEGADYADAEVDFPADL